MRMKNLRKAIVAIVAGMLLTISLGAGQSLVSVQGFEVCRYSGEIFGDPDNCHKFYVCDENLRARGYLCSEQLAFDPSINRCVPFEMAHNPAYPCNN